VERDDGSFDLRRTFVPEAQRGRGIGGRLTRRALEHARDTGRRVVPTCSFVASFIDRHPEFEELRAGAGRG
jgi:hypothetical protein